MSEINVSYIYMHVKNMCILEIYMHARNICILEMYMHVRNICMFSKIYAYQEYIKWMSENCLCISRNICMLEMC